MNRSALPCWNALPRLSRPVARMRTLAARMLDGAGDRWHERHGLAYQLELETPLERYSVYVVLDGCMGRIDLWLECGAIMPQLSPDLLEASGPADGHADALEWLLMPWLDELESMSGCPLRIERVAFREAPPRADLLAVSACLEDGRRAHLGISGSALSVVADAFTPAGRKPPPWCRVEVSWLLRLPALSIHEMRALTHGALLRAQPNHLQLQIGSGGIRMAAHWTNDDRVEVEGRVNTSASGSAGWGTSQALVSLDELTFDIDIVLSTQQLTVEQLGGICKGAVLPLAPACDGQRVALIHHGVTFARGELAYVEDEMVVMITECYESAVR